MGTYEKAYIYFDTNSLECRHSGKSLYLSQFIVNPIYYEIEDLIRNMGLTGKVEICTQIASSSWTPSGRKLGLPQPLRLRKQCQGMLQRVLLECSTPDSSSEGC